MADRFSVCWPRRAFQRRRHEVIQLLDCVLCERKLDTGRPSTQVICRLGTIPEAKLGDIAAQEAFWHQVSSKLGKMVRFKPRDLDEIEALIAEKVPHVLPQAVLLANVEPQDAPNALPTPGLRPTPPGSPYRKPVSYTV
jgi:hypothetical protein